MPKCRDNRKRKEKIRRRVRTRIYDEQHRYLRVLPGKTEDVPPDPKDPKVIDHFHRQYCIYGTRPFYRDLVLVHTKREYSLKQRPYLKNKAR